jgi:hypothetical protein
MLDENFYGKRPYIWWTGVVEDIEDPLKMGRLKIRIFGIHPKEKDLLPTESLPWSQAVHPLTGAKTASTPRFGDWVLGFFLDGEAAQMPVVTGVFSGIDQVQANVAGKEYVPPPSNYGFYDPRPKAKVDQGPRPRSNIEDRKRGEPAIQRRLAREIVSGTSVFSTNAKISRACDITGYVNAAAGVTKAMTGQIGQTIRKAINALLEVLGLDRTGVFSFIISELKRIQAIFKEIQRYIREAQYMLQMVNYALGLINDMVRFIATLPQQLASLLQACLSKMISDIGRAISNAISGAIPGEVGELLREVNNTVGQINSTMNSAGQLVQDARSTVTNVEITVNNVQNLPDALSTNSTAAVNSLTTTLSNQITQTVTDVKTQAVSTVYTMPPQNTDPQPAAG